MVILFCPRCIDVSCFSLHVLDTPVGLLSNQLRPELGPIYALSSRRRRRDHPHCCGSETRVDDVILLHCSLFLALLTQSAIVIPVHSSTSSTHRLLGLPRALFPSTYPWHMNAGNLSALIMCPK